MFPKVMSRGIFSNFLQSEHLTEESLVSVEIDGERKIDDDGDWRE